MSFHISHASAHANLDCAWLRDQTARLHQRHLQFRRHFRLDVDALLARAVKETRANRPVDSVTVQHRWSIDPSWSTQILAVESARSGAFPSSRVAADVVD